MYQTPPPFPLAPPPSLLLPPPPSPLPLYPSTAPPHNVPIAHPPSPRRRVRRGRLVLRHQSRRRGGARRDREGRRHAGSRVGLFRDKDRRPRRRRGDGGEAADHQGRRLGRRRLHAQGQGRRGVHRRLQGEDEGGRSRNHDGRRHRRRARRHVRRDGRAPPAPVGRQLRRGRGGGGADGVCDDGLRGRGERRKDVRLPRRVRRRRAGVGVRLQRRLDVLRGRSLLPRGRVPQLGLLR